MRSRIVIERCRHSRIGTCLLARCVSPQCEYIVYKVYRKQEPGQLLFKKASCMLSDPVLAVQSCLCILSKGRSVSFPQRQKNAEKGNHKYNSGNSLVVTHLITNPPVGSSGEWVQNNKFRGKIKMSPDAVGICVWICLRAGLYVVKRHDN